MTECRQATLKFQGICGKRIEGNFDGGMLSTDGGLLLVREVIETRGFFGRLCECFTDHRVADAITHSVESLLKQRIYGLVAGYEDLNDHDSLRQDAVLQLLCGNVPGTDLLASHSTLNRFELTEETVNELERYKKISCNDEKLREFLIDEAIRHIKSRKLKEIILDADATDIPLHGKQEDRFYHGYYGHYCYLPLYIFCGSLPVWAELRASNIDASLGTEAALSVIVSRIRKAVPGIRIIFRADSGFARESIMKFCEDNKIEFVIGLARNSRLEAEIKQELHQAEQESKETGKPVRIFKEFQYETLGTWSRKRRVIGKAEHLEKGSNPRFVVTSLRKPKPSELYELWYCKRGDAENRIKEQFQLFADRTSSSLKRANQLRLWFSTLAYLVIALFRSSVGLRNTDFTTAEPNTLRLRLIKCAVKVTVSARRIYLSYAEGFACKHIFYKVLKT
jgi:hypothetical protein